jgi:hypothetical protein
MLTSLMALPFVLISGILYVFVLWVMWMVVKALKGIDESLKQIANRPSARIDP